MILLPTIPIPTTPIYTMSTVPITPKTLPLFLTPKVPQQLPLYYIEPKVSPSPITLLLL